MKEGGKPKVIASRSDKLICNEMHSFCMTAGETYSEAIQMEAGLVTADKEDYHPQRMCPTLTRHRSVQLTRQQKAWRSALLGSIADDHKAEDMCSTLKWPSCSPIGQEYLNNGGGNGLLETYHMLLSY